jgi:hypothetical protein
MKYRFTENGAMDIPRSFGQLLVENVGEGGKAWIAYA